MPGIDKTVREIREPVLRSADLRRKILCKDCESHRKESVIARLARSMRQGWASAHLPLDCKDVQRPCLNRPPERPRNISWPLYRRREMLWQCQLSTLLSLKVYFPGNFLVE